MSEREQARRGAFLDHPLQTALLKVNQLSGWPDTEPPTTLDEARAFVRGIVEDLRSEDGARPVAVGTRGPVQGALDHS